MAVVSRWDLDGDLLDAVGANDGTAVGGPLSFVDSLVTSEPSGKALDLNGSTQAVSVANDASLQVTGAFWLSACVRRDDEGQGVIFVKGEWDFWLLFNTGDGLEAGFTTSGAAEKAVLSATDILPGHTYRVDAVFTGSALKLYVNGRLLKETAVTGTARTSTGALLIGDGPGSWNFDGSLDKLHIGNTAPSDAEVLAAYREESDIVFGDGFETGDVSLWASQQLVGAGAAQAVVSSEPAPQVGTYSLRSTLTSGDERAEVYPGHIFFSAGDDIYIRTRVLVRAGFPNINKFAVLWQLRDEGDGSPVVALEVEKGVFRLVGGPATGLAETIFWEGPVPEADRWYDVVTRVVCSEDAEAGKVELWLDAAKQPLLTDTAKTAIGKAYPKFGLYRHTSITDPGVVAHDAISITRSTPFAPDVITGAATGITPVKATLNGTVDPNELATTYYFEYGETEAYGTKVPASEDGDAGEGSEAVAVSEAIKGLKPNTTYHFRLVAENAEGESFGEDAEFTTEVKPVAESHRLVWELCDRQQNVLTRLDNRRAGGRVEIGANAMRRAFVPLSLEDPAYGLAEATKTLLRVTLKGPDDFSLPLFIGRVLIPENATEDEREGLGLNAVDPLYQLGKALSRKESGSTWEAKTLSATDQSQIMWALIEAATTHGIIEGDLPASVNRDRTYLPGKEVAQALIEMTEVINGPDFELEPVVAGDGTLTRFNTFHPRQGEDKSDDVLFVYGAKPSTASSFIYAPGGDGIVNRVVAVGAPLDVEDESPYAIFPAYVAEHADSIAEFGVFEEVIQLEDVVEGATLKSHAEAIIAARAYPIPYFDFTAAPEQVDEEPVGSNGVPPRFGIDYWIGDTVGAHAYFGAGEDAEGNPVDAGGEPVEPLELAGRVTDAVVTELESGQIAVKVSCTPEVNSEGITGKSIQLKVPEVVE